MELLYRYRLHWADVALFVGTAAILFGFAIWGFCNPDYFVGEDRCAPSVMAGVGVLTSVLIFIGTPKWVGITKDTLLVRTATRTLRFPLREIATAVPFEHKSARRAAGVRIGGIKLSVGKFHNATLGNFEMVTTDTANMLLLTTRKGAKIVINCPLQRLTNHPHWKASRPAGQA